MKGGATWRPEPVLFRGPAPLQEVVGQVFPHFETAQVRVQTQGEIHWNFPTAWRRFAEVGYLDGMDLAAKLGNFGKLVEYLEIIFVKISYFWKKLSI